MTITERDHAAVSEQVRELHRGTVVVDTLAGGPGVFTAAMHNRLAGLDETLPRPEFFRELQRMITSQPGRCEIAVTHRPLNCKNTVNHGPGLVFAVSPW